MSVSKLQNRECNPKWDQYIWYINVPQNSMKRWLHDFRVNAFLYFFSEGKKNLDTLTSVRWKSNLLSLPKLTVSPPSIGLLLLFTYIVKRMILHFYVMPLEYRSEVLSTLPSPPYSHSERHNCTKSYTMENNKKYKKTLRFFFNCSCLQKSFKIYEHIVIILSILS